MPTSAPSQLFSLLPPNARNLVQAGSGDGVLARHYKRIYPASFYQGLEGETETAQQARAWCDIVHLANLDRAGDDFYRHFAMADCWIFDRTLGRLQQPQVVLKAIHRHLAADACLVACVPNRAYWLSVPGASDTPGSTGPAGAAATHGALSRVTLLNMLHHAGFHITVGVALNGAAPPAAVLQALRLKSGPDGTAEQLLKDALTSHFLIKAMPA